MAGEQYISLKDTSARYRGALVLLIFIFTLLFPAVGYPAEVTLREYVELMVNERGKQWEAYFKASQIAVELARTNLEKELEKLNELRQAVERDRSYFIRTETAEAKFAGINKDIQEIKDRLIALETKIVTWVAAVGVLLLLLQLFLPYIRKREKQRPDLINNN